jgi:hypothetical protein
MVAIRADPAGIMVMSGLSPIERRRLLGARLAVRLTLSAWGSPARRTRQLGCRR